MGGSLKGYKEKVEECKLKIIECEKLIDEYRISNYVQRASTNLIERVKKDNSELRNRNSDLFEKYSDLFEKHHTLQQKMVKLIDENINLKEENIK